MKSKENIRPLRIISIILIVLILASLFLNFAWNRYKEMAEMGAKQLAQSVVALLHVEHIEAMVQQAEAQDNHLVEQSLENLVEDTESIYYAYILKEEREDIIIIADSSAADSIISQPTMASCESTVEINQLPFERGESFVTESISTSCGDWIRVLAPIFDSDNENILAVLGLSYSTTEWNANIWKKMIPDIIVAACLVALAFTIINLFKQNSKYKKAQQSRRESERSKSVFFSQIPGMAYRSKNDIDWTMEFVSEGCYELTGYKPESLISDKFYLISFWRSKWTGHLNYILKRIKSF